MVLDIWNYFRGYAIIEVEGFSVERFINLATHRGVYLWNIKRKKEKIQMCVSYKGYKILEQCASKTSCEIKILKEKGITMFIKKYKNRKLFFIGTFLFFILITLFSSCIWEIEIYGNQKLTDLEILQSLEEKGLKIITFKNKININDLEKEMIKQFEDIAWMSIEIKGTKAIVKVTEAVAKPKVIQEETPCDVVAMKDGIIQQITVQSGELKVAKDIVVKKGDILITGKIPMADETEKLVHASGEIKAKVWYKGQGVAPLETVIEKKTGLINKQRRIKIFQKEISLFNKNVKFDFYTVESMQKQFKIGKYYTFPIQLKTDTYYEVEKSTIKVNKEIAKKNAILKGMQKLKGEMPVETKIIDTSVEYIEKNNEMVANITLTCLERIDEKKIIEDWGQNIEQSNDGKNDANQQ